MSDSEKRRVTRAALNPRGAVPTPYEAKALEVLRDLEQRDRQLRDERRESEALREQLDALRLRAAALEAERDAVARLASSATEAQRARSLACSETCAKAAREVEAVRAEREGIRDQLGVANVARQEMAKAFAGLASRLTAVEARLADVLSPLAELRDAEGGESERLIREAFPELDRGSPTEGDCQSPPAHTLRVGGGS